MRVITHFVGGKAFTGSGTERGTVYDPALGVAAGSVTFADAADVDAAVEAAAAAALGWQESTLAQRTRILFAYRDLVDSHREELAALVTSEHGKTLADAAGEVARGLDVLELACGIPHLLKGEYSESVSSGVDTFSLRQPLGVVAGITPFNFPVMVPMWMFPLAIACGNTFVLKPSEKDPSAAVRLAELACEAGLPAGVLNVVHGGRVAVERILEHPGVAAVSFVGSSAVARHVYETCAHHAKRVQALGGAKNHMVVLPDADLDAAADAAVSAGFGSAGERCMAVSVVVAVDPVGDALVPKIAERMAALRVGPGSDPSSEMGPLVTRKHRDRVAGYLDIGAGEGAEVVVDGRSHPAMASGGAARAGGAGSAGAGGDGGFFLGPSLLDRVTPRMRVYDDEIFGPVLSVVRVPTFDEAVALVNANPYGNGAAVFTEDGGAARRFHHEVEAGMVGVNVPIPVPVAYHTFGGWKRSLFGDAHVYGTEGVRFYTRVKVVIVRWPGHGQGFENGPGSGGSGVRLGFPAGE